MGKDLFTEDVISCHGIRFWPRPTQIGQGPKIGRLGRLTGWFNRLVGLKWQNIVASLQITYDFTRLLGILGYN